MGDPLRQRRSPSDWAASGQVIEINEKLHNFKRLAGTVEADLRALDPDRLPAGWRDVPVTGRLSFGFADAQQAVPMLEGHVAVTVDAVCQRCLEPFRQRLDAELGVVLVADESLAGDAGFEVWELEGDSLQPLEVVDEALLMALPLVARHADDGVCRDAAVSGDMAAETVRPFANLKSQMNSES